MMTRVTTHPQIRHLILILGISFITTLALIGGTLALHTPGFALSSFAHAMAGHTLFGSTCQSTKGAQPTLCEHQDPQAQGCIADAQSIEVQDVFSRDLLIGEVDLRYSFTCKSFWTRTIAYAREEWRRPYGQWRFRAGGYPLRTPFSSPMFLRGFPGQAPSFLSHTMMPALVNYSWLPTKVLRGVTIC